VLVHDAARPFVTAAVISRAIEGAVAYGAAIAAIPVTDTVKKVCIVSSVVGVVVGLVAVVGVTLLVRYILDQDSTGQPAPSAPTNLPPSAIPTSILPTTPGTPSVPPTPAPSQQQSGPQSQQQSPARTDRSGDESR
jgi:hypothetical protein